MSRGRQLIIVLVAVLALSSSLSHAIMHLLDIRADGIDRAKINADASGSPALVVGSSLTFFGVSFKQLAGTMKRPLVTRGVGGCSPCELEPLISEVPEATRLIIGVSMFDLNESNLSDSRPVLVPFGQTFRDLRATHADWPSTKRVLSSYPLPWMRRLFPVAGRSTTVMVNVRDKAKALLKRAPSEESESRLTFKTDDDSQRPEKLSEWDPGRVGRNLSQLTGAGIAHGRFDGPKSMALARILEKASHQEPTVVLVLPVSPPYRRTFADETSLNEFEAALERMKTADANLLIIRLDREPALQSAEVFWDLVHLNDDGRRVATRLVIQQISAAGAR